MERNKEKDACSVMGYDLVPEHIEEPERNCEGDYE